MNIIDSVLNLETKKKEIENSIHKLGDEVFKAFINVPYEVIKIPNKDYSSILKKEEEYFPVLNIPNGYTKENEEFKHTIGFPKVCLRHSYILKNEAGISIEIIEEARLRNIIYIDNGYITLNFFIPTSSINYNVRINSIKYVFSRDFKNIDILNSIVNDKTATLVNYPFNMSYKEAKNNYESFLDSIGRTKNIVPLNQLLENTKINITTGLDADVNVSKDLFKESSVKYKNPQFTVIITYNDYTRFSIDLKPYFCLGIKIEPQKYEYIQLENGEYINEVISLEEVLKNS